MCIQSFRFLYHTIESRPFQIDYYDKRGLDIMSTPDLIAQPDSRRTRIIAVTQALFVTVLWSSSFIIIKFGLEEIPPLTYAGLRYSIGSTILLCLILAQPKMRESIRKRSRKWWLMLTVYGIMYIAVAQGTQFLGLFYLPAITLSLLLNLTPVLVLIFAIPWLGERPTRVETFLVLVGIFGVLLYFFPLDFIGVSIIGLIIGLLSLLSNAFSSLIGRAVNRTKDTPALVVTGIMMSVGSVFLMIAALLTEPIIPFSMTSWFYIFWLAVVNTALAFTLWSHSQRVLRAIDMTLINSTMMPQIVILSIFFLGEFPEFLDWVGLILLAISVSVVQILQTKKMNDSKNSTTDSTKYHAEKG
ncbi:MAG: DMT family transporter [Candidatus Thorarchaeota archaeon]|nr:MAG: DMT family transporter [Candidatus Thorarchaeota archaeon]